MDFLEEELEEFKNEAFELLADAEAGFLKIEEGQDFSSYFDAIFRAFHSIKGASGMLGLNDLQHHMHQLESHFQSFKGAVGISPEQGSYFLRGIDAGREILNGKKVPFSYDLPGVESPTVESKSEITGESSALIETEDLNEPILPPPVPVTKIFVIDDEESIVEILSDMLSDHGFKVIGFTNPIDAIKRIATEKPAVVLTDMKMPQMTGDQVLAEVRKINLDLPVIYVSGMLTKDLIISAMSHGLYSAIEKPFKETHVVAVVENAARRFQMWNLLNRSIDFVMFQFSDLDEMLKKSGKEQQRKIMSAELKILLEARRELRAVSRAKSQN